MGSGRQLSYEVFVRFINLVDDSFPLLKWAPFTTSSSLIVGDGIALFDGDIRRGLFASLSLSYETFGFDISLLLSIALVFSEWFGSTYAVALGGATISVSGVCTLDSGIESTPLEGEGQGEGQGEGRGEGRATW